MTGISLVIGTKLNSALKPESDVEFFGIIFDSIRCFGCQSCEMSFAGNCPAEAIIYGKRRDLIKEARKRINDNPDLYVDHIYGEHDAGGTSFMYMSPAPFNELGFNTSI